MANFDESYERTMVVEGDYSIDPDDPGGETYKGVSRRYHPLWSGWKTIDRVKEHLSHEARLVVTLNENSKLQSEVETFYKDHFWDSFLGDEIPIQSVADELFDTAVNIGIHNAVSFMQEALNLLNRNGKYYDDIVVDGVFGSTTLGTLERFFVVRRGKLQHLLAVANILQGMYYIERMRENPKKEKYLGWFARVSVGGMQ